MLYPELFKQLEAVRWNMDTDIPWDRFDATQLSDEQARTVLLAEYERTRERLHALQLEQRQLQMTTPAADVARQQALEQALARTQRDLHSLQRELDRKPPAGGSR